MSDLRACLPALLLLAFSTWCGTFDGAARADGALGGQLILLAVLTVAGTPNPLRLSRRENLVAAVFPLVLVLSLLGSPVSRAGYAAVLLLPAYLMVPSLVERSWPDAESRRRGLLAVTAVVGVVSAWSLVGWRRLGTPGASLPLGHHNLLAAWLVTLLPVALLAWRHGGGARILAGSAGGLALVALLATRSLSGLLAFAAVLVAASRRGRWKPIPAGLAGLAMLALLPVVGPRIVAVATGGDLSFTARSGYLEAAWRGFAERPLLGWGPGSASWILAGFLRPRPGVHPPDQVVADPHSLPLRIAFETGSIGLAAVLALVAVVLRARLREAPGDLPLRRAALLGLLGFGVAGLAGRPLAAPALVLAAVVLVACLQASGTPTPARRARLAGRVLPALTIALLLAPAGLAHLEYDRAVSEQDPRPRAQRLRQAVRLDAGQPLYRMRLALLERDLGAGPAANDALLAAESARGIAHFFLVAGSLGQRAGEAWAEDALLRACELNPLGALAPFRLATGAPDDPRAPVWAARAILAEPVLAASEAFLDRRTLLETAAGEIRRVGGVDPDWSRDLAESIGRLPQVTGATRSLVLELDGEGATSLSLHAFRRRPWPAYVDTVRVVTGAVPLVAGTAASRARETELRVFQAAACGLPRP